MWFFKEQMVDNIEKIFPKITTIARMSKCSTRTVNTFIKKYELLLIGHDKKWNPETHKHEPNQYFLNPDFFETMILLDECGYLRNWTKKTKVHVLKKYIDNEWFLQEILLYRKEHMNNQIAHGFYRKLRTIKNLILLRKEIYKDPCKDRCTDSGRKEAKEALKGVRELTNAEMNRLTEQFGNKHLLHAKEVLHFVRQKSVVSSPANFLFSEARKSTLKQLRAHG